MSNGWYTYSLDCDFVLFDGAFTIRLSPPLSQMGVATWVLARSMHVMRRRRWWQLW